MYSFIKNIVKYLIVLTYSLPLNNGFFYLKGCIPTMQLYVRFYVLRFIFYEATALPLQKFIIRHLKMQIPLSSNTKRRC